MLCAGLHNSELIRAYMSLDWRARALAVLVKAWAKARAINDSSRDTLSSFSYTLLTIFFLQQRGILPNLQSPELLAAYARWRGRPLEAVTVQEYSLRYCADPLFLEQLVKVSDALPLPARSHR